MKFSNYYLLLFTFAMTLCGATSTLMLLVFDLAGYDPRSFGTKGEFATWNVVSSVAGLVLLFIREDDHIPDVVLPIGASLWHLIASFIIRSSTLSEIMNVKIMSYLIVALCTYVTVATHGSYVLGYEEGVSEKKKE